jgi:hypothetical protein
LRTNGKIKLEVLDLAENSIRDRGAMELSASIKINKSLNTINIRDNSIMMKGGAMLVSSMLLNRTIHTIKAEGNVFFIRYIDKLKDFSMRNTYLQNEQLMPKLEKDKRKLN